MAQEPDQIELDLDPSLDIAAREALITRLEHQLGVVSAWFDAHDHTRLIVHVEPGHFSPTTLSDFVRGLGPQGALRP